MENNLFSELSEEERRLFQETLSKLIEQTILIANEYSMEFIEQLERNKKWKTFCEKTKE